MQQEEVKKMLEILRSAIQMEIDGKEFYQQAGEKSSNKLARELFQGLASEEDDHRRKFEEIYEALKKGQDWPAVEPPSGKGKQLESIFLKASKELGSEIKIAQSELEAIETAMNMELKTYDLYQALAAEERGHHLVLLDSYEYLTDPTGWFTVKEHWTLDGG